MVSLVLEHKPAKSTQARQHFLHKLTVETDASDVYADLRAGVDAFVVVDPRSAEAYAKGHVPGALNLPYREIDRDAVSARLPQGKVYVLCCAGIGCNASAKAAIRLAAFGCAIKELVGGLEWWQKSGYPVQTGAEPGRLE